jgi:hypothetical protein
MNELERWYKITLDRKRHVNELKNEDNDILMKAVHKKRYKNAEKAYS